MNDDPDVRAGVRRRRLLGGFWALVFLGLAGRLWSLQIVSGAEYDELALGNRTRLVQTEAPRGRIYDVEGRAMADRRESLSAALDLESLAALDRSARSEAFAAMVVEFGSVGHTVTVDDVAERYEQSIGRQLRPEPILSDISAELWIALEERSVPGLVIERSSVRHYPFGTTAAHVVGHLGTVADGGEAHDLNQAPASADKPYAPGDIIGRSGLELMFESELRGTPEIRRVEVDARNRIVGTVEIVQEAVPGNDLHLNIDVDLQRQAERIVAEELLRARSRPVCPDECEPFTAPAGSLVALQPDDGAVVALVSLPGFDPGWFVDGLSPTQAERLFQDDGRPLFNRAIAGRYPAGSTFKPIVAVATQASGIRDADEIWTDLGQHHLADCSATTERGCRFRNAGGVVMGPVDLRSALARSSDTYFYSAGEMLWGERDRLGETVIQDTSARFGLGHPTGIDLPAEASGVVPRPQDRAIDGEEWHTGDNVNLAIGQGDLLVTPLQLANVYAALAEGGRRHRPRVVDRITHGETGAVVRLLEPTLLQPTVLEPTVLEPTVLEPTVLESTGLEPEGLTAPAGASVGLDALAGGDVLQAVGDGLASATRSGTAAAAFAGFAFATHPVSGKTGTAEVTGKADLSLFAGYGTDLATGDRLAVVVVLEEAGFGGVAAAPAARSFLDAAFELTPAPLLPEPPPLSGPRVGPDPVIGPDPADADTAHADSHTDPAAEVGPGDGQGGR